MQRESLINGAADREELQSVARQIGSILEDVSRATGSVAHFFKNIEVGQTSGQSRTQSQSYDKTFEAIVKECEVLRQVGRPGEQPQAPAAQEQAAVLPELFSIVDNQDMIKMMMRKFTELNHVLGKTKGVISKLLAMFNGSADKLGE